MIECANDSTIMVHISYGVELLHVVGYELAQTHCWYHLPLHNVKH